MLGAPHHHAYVVEDIEASVSRLVETLGAGPFFLVERVPLENVLSHGAPADFTHNSAFGSCGGSPIELIETISLAPDRVEERFSASRPRIHHVGFVVSPAELEGVRSSLEDQGLPRYLSSQLGEVDSTLHDASALLGHDVEIHLDCEGLRGFFEMVIGAGEGWDGTEPLRAVEG